MDKDIDVIGTKELEKILEVKHERELSEMVATYVTLDGKKVMISQYKCYAYYTTIQEENYMVTLIDSDNQILGDILNVTKVNKVNDVRTELYIEL